MQHPKRAAIALAFATFFSAASSRAASNVPEPAATPSAAATVVAMAAPISPREPIDRDFDWSKIPQDEARELLRIAFDAEREGKLDFARRAIQQAHDGVKSAAIEFELGLVHLRAGQPDVALRIMERGMTLFPNEALPRPAAYYARKMEEARRRVAKLYVFVMEPHAKLFVDDLPVVEWPFVDHVYVLPGRHTFRAFKPGFTRSAQEIEVEAGETQEVVLDPWERPPRVLSTGLLTAPISFDTEAPPWSWSTKLAVGSAIGFAVSASALAVGLVSWGAAGRDEVTKANVAKGVSIGSGVAMGLSILGTTIGLTSGKPSPPSPPPGPIVIYVQASSSGAAMSLRGSF